MEKLLTILILCFSTMSFGQGYSNFGNTNPNDTARTKNHMLVEGKMRLPGYASSDSTFLMKLPGSNIISYPLNTFLSRIGSYVGTPTLQQVLNAGSNLTGSNTIDVGTQLRFAGPSLYFTVDNAFWDGVITVQEAPIVYSQNFAPFDSLEVPNMDAVEDYVGESSFDYNVTTTITSLTDSRFVRTVSTITYGGNTFNSTYFSQVGTTITFLNNLKFYNGQTLTFLLK